MSRQPLIFISFYLTLFFFLFSFQSKGQELEDYSLLRNIRNNNRSYHFFVAPVAVQNNDEFNVEKFYCWFKAQKIQLTQGGASGQLLHGDFEAHYFNKQLAEKGTYKNGLKNGVWNFWYDNGFLKLTEEWNNGTVINKSVYRDSNGVINYTIDRKLFKTIYISSKDKIIASKDSSRVTAIQFEGNSKKSVSHTRNGKLQGKQIYYDEYGNVESIECYKNGIKDGKQVINKDSSVFFKQGELVVKKEKSKDSTFNKRKPLKENMNENPSDTKNTHKEVKSSDNSKGNKLKTNQKEEEKPSIKKASERQVSKEEKENKVKQPNNKKLKGEEKK